METAQHITCDGFLGAIGQEYLAVAPAVARLAPKGRRTIRAHTARQNVRLDQQDIALLNHFTGTQTANAVGAALLKDGGRYGTELDIYLAVSRYLALGLLIKVEVLQAELVGGLIALASGPTAAGPTRGTPIAELAGSPRLRNTTQDNASASQLRAELAQTPMPIFERPDGAQVLIAHTNLACAAHHAGLPLRVQHLKTADAIALLTQLEDEFFGSKRGDMPYQSIFRNGTEIVQGRRPDLYDRFAKMRPKDLRGRRILDLGCNIGMNSYLAIEHGARATLGLDLAPFSNAARRLNLYFDAPCDFRAHDLNKGLPGLGSYDTVFIFALIGHLNSADGIREIVKSVEAKTIYLETHCEIQHQGDTQAFMNSGIFSEVTCLGNSLDNIARQQHSRKFFRCIVKR